MLLLELRLILALIRCLLARVGSRARRLDLWSIILGMRGVIRVVICPRLRLLLVRRLRRVVTLEVWISLMSTVTVLVRLTFRLRRAVLVTRLPLDSEL